MICIAIVRLTDNAEPSEILYVGELIPIWVWERNQKFVDNFEALIRIVIFFSIEIVYFEVFFKDIFNKNLFLF